MNLESGIFLWFLVNHIFATASVNQHQKGCSWKKRDGCFTWPKAIKNSFFPICHC